MLKRIYHYLLSMVRSPRAIWALLILGFLEAFISPLSPLVLLIPMSIARPERAWQYVYVVTLAATVGSVLGYGIGYEFIVLVLPYIEQFGYADAYQVAVRWFDHWGLWMVFISSLTPLPFKIFTIAAGAMSLHFLPFLLTAFVGRLVHFALVPLGLDYCASPLKRWFTNKFWK